MPFGEAFEDAVVYRLGGGDHEGAAGRAQHRQQIGPAQQVLDFDGDVVAERGKLPVERLDDFDGVARAVEEIGVAEGDVLRPGGHLLADVGQNNFGSDHAEGAAIYGNNGAVAAQMFAAARGFRVADDAVRAVGKAEV